MKQSDQKIEELFNAQVHLGHRKNRIHPKSKKFIYTIQNRQSIIDLTKTVAYLKKAKEFISQAAKEKKKLLVVATKKISAPLITKLCQEKNIHYITLKWPAGLLTNFKTIKKNIETLKQMREEKDNGQWDRFPKHERIKLNRKLNRLQRIYGGIVDMETLPDLLFIIDIKKEKNALSEATKLKIPVVALVDTNVNPQRVDYPIPANDDALSSIEILTKELLNAYARQQKQ